jgi:DNA-directed RNA polymerase subunit RPC12/RpoP
MEMESLENLLESQGLLTNVKKFICSNCPRTFKTQKGLDTHERQCQEKKTYKCEYCDEIAKTPKGLRSHCRKKHGIDNFQDTCSESSDN